jgi:hypothetical protein
MTKLNPFAWVRVRNSDSDEAGDYRQFRRWWLWFNLYPGFEEA